MGLPKLSPIEREIGDASQQDAYLQIPNDPRLLQPPREYAQIHSSKIRALFESFEPDLESVYPCLQMFIQPWNAAGQQVVLLPPLHGRRCG